MRWIPRIVSVVVGGLLIAKYVHDGASPEAIQKLCVGLLVLAAGAYVLKCLALLIWKIVPQERR